MVEITRLEKSADVFGVSEIVCAAVDADHAVLDLQGGGVFGGGGNGGLSVVIGSVVAG